jgi:Xaa-Pro aminopeptidase
LQALFNAIALIITLSEVYLYINNDKIDNEVKAYFDSNLILIKKYSQFYDDLVTSQAKYLLDINSANYAIKQAIEIHSMSEIVLTSSPITLGKALKNTVEINGAKEAHKKDAIAFIKWWYWMENNYQNTDEIKAGSKLTEFRAQQKNYVEDSFNYIVGFADHSALPHYSPTQETNKKITNQDTLLIDSGGQYREGTTDITRVLHFGSPTAKQREYYTLVLKGHLKLGKAIYPKGTTGSQLDVLAREYLWSSSADFSHGTGHGVSSFLGVHEGPQRINPTSRVELMPGMILSNEPGVYFPTEFGIRIENLIYIKENNQESPTGHGPFYCFESLTLIPYEYNLLEVSMLTLNEKSIINEYYNAIREKILPLIEEEEIKKFLLGKLKRL